MSLEEDINWEELAMKLIKENKVLKRKIEELEIETKEKKEDWSDHVAPIDSDLPLLLTLCTPIERETLFARARQKIVGGKWTGTMLGGGSKGSQKRPALAFEPSSIKEKEASGELARKEIPDKRRPGKFQRQVRNSTFPLPHILLIGNKIFPSPGDVASHLCHNIHCCDVTHFAWESHTKNIRREKCRKKKECTCGFQTKCRFDCK